jgi:hypothetical protein
VCGQTLFFPPEPQFDLLDDMLDAVEHQPILEPKHLDPGLIQVPATTAVAGRGFVIHVHLSIQLDRQPFLDAVEIKNIRTDAVQATKLAAVDL